MDKLLISLLVSSSLFSLGFLKKEEVEIELLNDLLVENVQLKELPKAEETLPVYRQTYYSVEQGETSVGALYHYSDPEMKIINNVIHFNDEEFGYIPVVAINLDEVIESGQNEKGIWNIYGTVLNLTYPNEQSTNAIILDACGACRYDDKIDLWVYENQEILDVENVTIDLVRKGWNQE